MEAKYANTFIKGAQHVFNADMGIELHREYLRKASSPTPSLPISIIIGMTGEIRGQVVFSLDRDMAYAITEKTLPGKSKEDIEKYQNSTVSELANMITGQASKLMAGENMVIEITPPSVMTGTMLMEFPEMTTISLGLITGIGRFEINIAIEEEN